MENSIKRLLLGTSILSVVGFGFSNVAYAQDADEPLEVVNAAEEEAMKISDQVVVTGSRLRRNEFTSASPLQVIDGELARDLGLVDAADLLGQTTVVQGQQISTGVSTSAGILSENGPGSSTASLRGLDPGRTLVLVNGRRLAPAGVRGVPSAPDLNLIPGTLIDRVDVLLDGASSVYGSDAVAGVVNYELRRDFDGIQLDAFTTMPEYNGNEGNQQVYTATAGVSGEKGFIGFAVEHNVVDGFTEATIGELYSPYSAGCRGTVLLGDSGTVYHPDRCGGGSFGAGAVTGGRGFLYFDQGANVAGLPQNFRPVSVTSQLLQADDPIGQAFLIYPEEYNAAFSPDFKRTSLFTLGEYNTDLYGDLTVYFEGSHAFRETNTNTSGQGNVRISDTYALNPFGATVTQYFNSRFINETEVAQTRFVGGIKGELPFLEKSGLENWAYDVYASYSRSSGQDRVQGIPYLPRLEQTLANTVVDPVTGEASCTARSIPGVGQNIPCRPLEFQDPTFLFTGRFVDEDDNAYLFPNRLTDTVVQQTVYSGYLGGDLFEMPFGGGTVLAGFGGEYREDIIETNTALSGDFQGFSADPGSNGSRSLKEVFGEIELPLLSDRPLVDKLTLNLSARYTDESNFGGESTYGIKGVYAPTDFLTFRGTYGTSYRAPDLGQQFGGNVTGFENPSDPCRVSALATPFVDHDNDPTTGDQRVYNRALDNRTDELLARCANGGGAFNIPGTDPTRLGILGYDGASPVFAGSPTLVASGSNPNLLPETSEAISAGIVFDQPFTDAFDLKFSATFFRIKIQDEIDQLTANTIVNRCYNDPSLSDPTCGSFTRDPRVTTPTVDETTGEVSFVSALNRNLGEQLVEGIDYNVELDYDVKPSFLDVPVEYSLIARATQSLTQTEDQVLATGTIIDDDLLEFGNPEWRLNLTNRLKYKDFQFLFQSRYISSMVEDARTVDPDTGNRVRNEFDRSFFSQCVQAGDFTNDAAGNPVSGCEQIDGLDSYWVHNASVAFARDTFVVRVGVNNVFNDAPPLTTNNELSSLGGIGYDLGGRTYFANVTKRF